MPWDTVWAVVGNSMFVDKVAVAPGVARTAGFLAQLVYRTRSGSGAGFSCSCGQIMRRIQAQTSLASDSYHLQVQGCTDQPGLAIGLKVMIELTLAVELTMNARE